MSSDPDFRYENVTVPSALVGYIQAKPVVINTNFVNPTFRSLPPCAEIFRWKNGEPLFAPVTFPSCAPLSGLGMVQSRPQGSSPPITSLPLEFSRHSTNPNLKGPHEVFSWGGGALAWAVPSKPVTVQMWAPAQVETRIWSCKPNKCDEVEHPRPPSGDTHGMPRVQASNHLNPSPPAF